MRPTPSSTRSSSRSTGTVDTSASRTCSGRSTTRRFYGRGSPASAARREAKASRWRSSFEQSPWPTLRPGAAVSYTIHFRNTGTEMWQRGIAGRQVNLGVSGDSTAAADAGMAVGWLSANRVATTSETTVAPNAIATFTFVVRAPAAPGSYRLALHPVLEGVQHLEDEGV